MSVIDDVQKIVKIILCSPNGRTSGIMNVFLAEIWL